MNLGFKKQFVAPILARTKIHSIREDSKSRWKPGNVIHMATGTRTKNYNNFNTAKCISIQPVSMFFDANELKIVISVSGRKLTDKAIERLAIKDGFESLSKFYIWWMPVLMKIDSNTFTGKIIHWTDYRY